MSGLTRSLILLCSRSWGCPISKFLTLKSVLIHFGWGCLTAKGSNSRGKVIFERSSSWTTIGLLAKLNYQNVGGKNNSLIYLINNWSLFSKLKVAFVQTRIIYVGNMKQVYKIYHCSSILSHTFKNSQHSSIWRRGIDQKYLTQMIDPIEYILKMIMMLWWHPPPPSWYLSWLKENVWRLCLLAN